MYLSPRFHLNGAAHKMVRPLHESKHDPNDLPIYCDGHKVVIYNTLQIAERESDCPLVEREVILVLVDAATGEVVAASMWSEEETIAHRQALKDEELMSHSPVIEPS